MYFFLSVSFEKKMEGQTPTIIPRADNPRAQHARALLVAAVTKNDIPLVKSIINDIDDCNILHSVSFVVNLLRNDEISSHLKDRTERLVKKSES